VKLKRIPVLEVGTSENDPHQALLLVDVQGVAHSSLYVVLRGHSYRNHPVIDCRIEIAFSRAQDDFDQ